MTQASGPTFWRTAKIREDHWDVARSGRPSGSTRGDHRSGRAEDGHQRSQFRANAFMADFEDSLSPTWDNVIRDKSS